MSRPWMPLYIADYRKDTGHLSAAEHGAYLLLIMHYWATGRLPDNDRQLSRIACMSPAEWKRARPIVEPFFEDGWKHGRIDEELAKAADISNKRSEARKQRGNKKPTNEPTNVELLSTQSQSQSPIPSEAKKASSGSRPKKVRATYPDDFEKFWKNYPKTPVMSKSEALKEWNKLSDDEKQAAIAAVPKFSAWLKSQKDHPAVHACRFLSQRRFEGFDEPEGGATVHPIGFYAAMDSPELAVWDAHNRATKGVNASRDRNGGWRFPTQWPPEIASRETVADGLDIPEYLRRAKSNVIG